MPMKDGYSTRAIAHNIRELQRAGYSHSQAVAIALKHARETERPHEKRRREAREKLK